MEVRSILSALKQTTPKRACEALVDAYFNLDMSKQESLQTYYPCCFTSTLKWKSLVQYLASVEITIRDSSASAPDK